MHNHKRTDSWPTRVNVVAQRGVITHTTILQDGVTIKIGLSIG